MAVREHILKMYL